MSVVSIHSDERVHGGRPHFRNERSRGLLALGFLVLALSACLQREVASARGPTNVYFDFLANFPAAHIEPEPRPGAEPNVRIYAFVRDRQRKRSLVTIADAEARFHIPVIQPDSEFRGYVGMPFNLGDGALAELRLVQEGQTHRLWTRYMDPARRASDRTWLPVIADLTPYAGRPGEIIFSARGPTGDLTADWIGWAEPVLCRRH